MVGGAAKRLGGVRGDSGVGARGCWVGEAPRVRGWWSPAARPSAPSSLPPPQPTLLLAAAVAVVGAARVATTSRWVAAAGRWWGHRLWPRGGGGARVRGHAPAAAGSCRCAGAARSIEYSASPLLFTCLCTRPGTQGASQVNPKSLARLGLGGVPYRTTTMYRSRAWLIPYSKSSLSLNMDSMPVGAAGASGTTTSRPSSCTSTSPYDRASVVPVATTECVPSGASTSVGLSAVIRCLRQNARSTRDMTARPSRAPRTWSLLSRFERPGKSPARRARRCAASSAGPTL